MNLVTHSTYFESFAYPGTLLIVAGFGVVGLFVEESVEFFSGVSAVVKSVLIVSDDSVVEESVIILSGVAFL